MVDNAIQVVDSDGDTLRANAIGPKLVITTVAKGQHVDDGLGVALNERQALELRDYINEFLNGKS
jgi:hypothetical protein